MSGPKPGPVPTRRCTICREDVYHWERDCPVGLAAPELLSALEPFAEISKYPDLLHAIAEQVRGHERESLILAFAAARAAIEQARGARGTA